MPVAQLSAGVKAYCTLWTSIILSRPLACTFIRTERALVQSLEYLTQGTSSYATSHNSDHPEIQFITSTGNSGTLDVTDTISVVHSQASPFFVCLIHPCWRVLCLYWLDVTDQVV